MNNLGTLHITLERCAHDFLGNPTEENGNRIVEEFCRLIGNDAEIIVDGIKENGITQPSGYYGPDGRFYIHVFSSRLDFDASTAMNLRVTHLMGLWHLVEENQVMGGFSLNHVKGKGTILIQREDIDTFMKTHS